MIGWGGGGGGQGGISTHIALYMGRKYVPYHDAQCLHCIVGCSSIYNSPASLLVNRRRADAQFCMKTLFPPLVNRLREVRCTKCTTFTLTYYETACYFKSSSLDLIDINEKSDGIGTLIMHNKVILVGTNLWKLYFPSTTPSCALSFLVSNTMPPSTLATVPSIPLMVPMLPS